MSNKITILILAILISLTGCKKETNLNDEVALKLKGEWTAISLKVDGTETITTNIVGAKTTFFDIEGNVGSYNTKIYLVNVLSNETEGSFVVSNDGTKLTLDENGNNGPNTVNIDEISNSTLKTSGTDDNNKPVFYIGSK